jgi:hypothetical protein
MEAKTFIELIVQKKLVEIIEKELNSEIFNYWST